MGILFFDTETTGVYNFQLPPSDPSQPHLVQLGAVLHDENRNLRASLNLIIRPDGWGIPAEASAIHGITTEHAWEYGVPLLVALQAFDALLFQANCIVAHNISFDEPVMATQLYREGLPNYMTGKKSFCTMKASTDICKIPGPRGYKWPKLQEAHQFFTGEGFDNAHDAMADVLACARVYYHLVDKAVV